MTIKRSILLFLAVICIRPMGATATADRIILKDGTVERSDRIWESENYYHFILQGTKSVEIRYAKTIVDRIERDQSAQSADKRLSDPAQRDTGDGNGTADRPRDSKMADTESRGSSADPVSPPSESIIMETRGLLFYDPRRPDHYRVSRQSGYQKLRSALDAVSRLYGRSPQWVEQFMGDSNDLGSIHRNLMAQIKKEQPDAQAKKPESPSHNSEQLQPESLKRQKRTVSREPSRDIIPAAGIRPSDEANGVRFYDPRRSEKYWSGKMTRHNTLHEAVRALADQYQVSEQWISDHMGDTNDLAQIHRNIRNSLSPPSN